MFGGLQIKDATPSKAAEDEGDGKPEPSATAAPGISGFGFMNSGDPATATAAPAPATSSFSFMNSAATVPAPEGPPAPADAAPATMTSGFSFMAQDSATATPDGAAEIPAASSINATPNVPSSGFDFMNAAATPAVSDAVNDESAVSTTVEEPPTPAVASGFSFLSDSTPLAPMYISSSTVPAATPPVPNMVTPALNTTPAKTGGLIAGAGVTFGTSSAKPRIKKKKSRAAKIGMGASINDTSTTSAPPPPPPVAPTPAAAPNEAKSARDEAMEAAKRAEAFIQENAVEKSRSSTESTTASKTVSPTNVGIETKESTDEILEAARVAAENAKILQSQQKGKGGGFMGTFFKGFRASSNTVSMSSGGPMSNNSKHSISSQSVGSNSSAKTKDRLARKQPQIPEPTLSRSDEENGDDEGVVTTSVESYEPAAPKPTEYAPVTADANDIATTTISKTPVFVPAAIPPAPAQKSSFSFMVPSYGEAKPAAQPSIETPVEVKPPVDNSAKQKFVNHQNYFSESVNRAMKKVENARNLKKGLLEERFVALAKERFASREIDQIEELQQAAIDEEDYEQADELGQKLDAHKREKSEVAAMLVNNKIALEKLESENLSLGELVVSCFDDLALRLNDLKKKEISTGKKDDNEIMMQYESISKQLSAEHERLQQDSKRLERDEELVGEERKELEDSIKDQTGEIEVEKEEAETHLKEVENEIEELRKELEEKKKKAADLRTKMYGLEDSISKVRVKFSRQLTRVDKKELSLRESRRDWEIENDQHKRQKDAHDIQVQAHCDTILAHEELMTSLESELKLSKEFSEIIPTQLGFMEDNNESEGRDDDEGSLAQLKANVVKCEGAIDAVKKELKIASTVIQNLQSERDALVTKIPNLEKEKKTAAAARNFKAAGKFSKEIKDANIRIKECEDELDGDAKTKKSSTEENLRKLDLELLEAKKVADAEEKIFGGKRMKTLATKISQLVKEKDGKCGNSSSEGKSVKSVAARVLEGQIMLLKAEGHELGTKYGGWEQLMESIDLDDGESTNISKGSNDNLNEVLEPKDDQQTSESSLPNKERLAKAKELLAKCSEFEEKIQDAADREDFETATELQETLDKINIEIEELNITDEECELLAEISTLPDEDPPEDPPEESTLTNEERLSKIKDLLTKKSEFEQKVEEAVEKEDFEAANASQTMLDEITAELTALNVTDEEKELGTADEEKELATAGDDSSGEIPSVQKAEEATLDEEEEEKKEVDKEQGLDSDHEALDNDE